MPMATRGARPAERLADLETPADAISDATNVSRGGGEQPDVGATGRRREQVADRRADDVGFRDRHRDRAHERRRARERQQHASGRHHAAERREARDRRSHREREAGVEQHLARDRERRWGGGRRGGGLGRGGDLAEVAPTPNAKTPAVRWPSAVGDDDPRDGVDAVAEVARQRDLEGSRR